MSNIYLKVNIETLSKLFWDFLSLQNLSPGQFGKAATHADIIEF